MANGVFVSYLRVSTREQGRSGLGIEAQREAVNRYLNGGHWQLAAEFVETESGRQCKRPQLENAIEDAKLRGAKLVVAKLDRLARDAHFLLGLVKAKVPFVCCDMPSANQMTVGIMAVVAEQEAIMISERTKAALLAAKARGVRLGNPNLNATPQRAGAVASRAIRIEKANLRASRLRKHIVELRKQGSVSLAALAKGLDAKGFHAPRGGQWSATQVARVLNRLALGSG